MTIDNDIQREIEERAHQRGYDQPMEYLRDLLQRDATEENEALEKLLLERLNDPRPGIEFTSEFQERFRERIHRRRQNTETQP